MTTKPKTVKKKPRQVNSEHLEQSLFINWKAEAMEMQTDVRKRLALKWTHAVPNGFYRSVPARMKAKREGVTSGILDLCVPAPELAKGARNSTAYHGLYIEMKKPGNKASDNQREFMDYLDLVHYRNAVCYTWQCAARLVVEHLGLTEYPEIPEPDIERVARLKEQLKKTKAKAKGKSH